MTTKEGPKVAATLGKAVGIFLLFALAASAVSLGVNYWVYREVQKRLKVRVEGQYVPSFFSASFRLDRATFNWEDKVRLLDGSLEVGFDPASLFSSRGIRIVIKSRNARIKLLGSWAVQEGVEDAMVDTLLADIVLGRRRITGINEIEAKSKSFQFSLKNVASQRKDPDIREKHAQTF